MAEHAFYTVGHSNRTVTELADLLESAGIARVVDVRTLPRSRANPQFNGDVLPESLTPFHIGYTHLPELAGLRRKSATVPDEVNAWWKNRSFHNYADHALSEEFSHGLEQLLSLGRQETCAVMCAEAVWWRCHRRIVADYLLHHGARVFHLMGAERMQPAEMNPAAQPTENGKLVYRDC